MKAIFTLEFPILEMAFSYCAKILASLWNKVWFYFCQFSFALNYLSDYKFPQIGDGICDRSFFSIDFYRSSFLFNIALSYSAFEFVSRALLLINFTHLSFRVLSPFLLVLLSFCFSFAVKMFIHLSLHAICEVRFVYVANMDVQPR